VKVVCREDGPPAMQMIDGNATGCPQQQQTPVVGRKKSERIHGKAGSGGVDNQRQGEHDTIDGDHRLDELTIIEQAPDQRIMAPAGPRPGQATVRTGFLVDAHQFPAIGAQERLSFLIFHKMFPSALPGFLNHGEEAGAFSITHFREYLIRTGWEALFSSRLRWPSRI